MALGTQLNVAGVVDLFHMVGVTPDASDLSRAFGGHEPEHTVTITRTELDEQRKLLIPASTDRIDFVMLGCPHYTYRQICRAAALMERTPPKVPVWILTSAQILRWPKPTDLHSSLPAAARSSSAIPALTSTPVGGISPDSAV